jgi:branched-chain amino acid transport system substrate-binding protein
MRRPSAKTFRLAAMIAASAAVAACGLSSANATNTLLAGPSGQPITVGISEPLSGPAQAQGFEADGQACLRGYKLWASDVNSHGGLLGRPVKLIVMNDEGYISSTKYDYNWLIKHDHVDLTLAPFSSLLNELAAGPVTEKLHYALAAGQAGAPAVYALHDHYMFSTNVPVAIQMVPFAKWVVSLPPSERPTTAAYPIVNNPFSYPPVKATQATFEHAGIKTVYRPLVTKQGIGYLDTSPSALKKDANAVVDSGAQVVVLGSVDVPTVSAFMNQFAARNFHPKIFIAAAGPDQGQQFLNAVGTSNAIGAMVPNGWYGGFPNALSHIMVQDYIAKYGGTASEINADVAESYSAGQVLQAAAEATGGTVQPTLATWLHSHTIQTVLGPVAFASDGSNTQTKTSATIFQWQPGPGGTGARFVQVLPAPPALGAFDPLPVR